MLLRMPSPPSAARPSSPAPGPRRPLSDRRLLARRIYGFRVLGLGLAALPIAVVLDQIDAGPASWAWWAFLGLLWPHLAWLHAARADDPYRAELRNQLVDAAIAGSVAPLMHFNLLPSLLLPTMAMADKINTGVRGLWLRVLPLLLGGALVGGLFTGFALRLDTDMAVVVACMPILVLHTLAVSAGNYALVRRVQRQNLQLDTLSRQDGLTGLLNRGGWEAQAVRALARFHAGRGPVCLLLLDLDDFKHINDHHGHGVGDDVLRAVAAATREHLGEGAGLGRLGGDEFAALVNGDAATVARSAERLRAAIESLRLPGAPTVRCSISIGLAQADTGMIDLRRWTEAADRALYRAKHDGRNRAMDAAAVDS